MSSEFSYTKKNILAYFYYNKTLGNHVKICSLKMTSRSGAWTWILLETLKLHEVNPDWAWSKSTYDQLTPVIFYNKWVSEWMKLPIILHVCLFLGTLIYICINYGLNLKHQLKNKRVDFNWSVSLCLVIIPYLFSDVFDQLPIKKGRINWTLHVTSETIVIKT